MTTQQRILEINRLLNEAEDLGPELIEELPDGDETPTFNMLENEE